MPSTRAIGIGMLAAACVATVTACSSSGGSTPATSGGSGSAATSGSSPAPSGSRPAASSSATSSGPAFGRRELALTGSVEKDKGQTLVLVPVTLNGKRFEFVLDTGASVTVIDSNAAKTAGLKVSALRTTGRTLGCTVKPMIASVTGLQLGGVTLPAGRLPVQSLGLGSARIKGMTIGGLLGADVQALGHRLSVDYRTGRVEFDAPAPTGGQSVAVRVLRLSSGVAVIAPVTVSGHRLQLQVDTGASRSTVSTATASTLHLPTAGSSTKVDAAGCPASVTPVTLSGAKIGAVAVPKATIDRTQQGSPIANGVVGLFGSDLLSTYGTVTVDFTARKLTLGA